MGDAGNPITQHRYLYGNADGINNIDPSGKFTIAQLAFTTGTIGALAAAASISRPDILGPMAQVPYPGDPYTETTVHRIVIKNSRKNIDELFDRMATFADFPASQSSIDGVPVTGVGDYLNFHLKAPLHMAVPAQFTKNDNAPVSVYKFDSANRIFAVETMQGHPLAGWRYWRTYHDSSNNIVIETVAMEHPTTRRNYLMLKTGGRDLQMLAWNLQLGNLASWSGGTVDPALNNPDLLRGKFYDRVMPEYKPAFSPAMP